MIGQQDNSTGAPEEGPVDLSMQDWLLQTFVKEANARNGEFAGVTLMVGGAMISGTLVGVSEYFKGISKTFIKEDETPEEGTWGAWLLEASEDSKHGDDDDLPNPNYIHLRDARVHANGERPVPTTGGVWWRGKISRVDAFWIGRLRASADE